MGSRRQAYGRFSPPVSSIIGRVCHALLSALWRGAALCLLAAATTSAQAPPARPAGIEPPGPNEVVVWALSKWSDGPVYHLRGNASLQTTEMQLWADRLDYNEETGKAEARGDVRFKHFLRGEELWADEVEYDLKEDTGQFRNLRGSVPARVEHRPGLLTTSNPFYFEGRSAERVKDKYILHDGLVTNCRLPKPWWALRSPRFEIVPGDRALAYRATFRVRGIPLLYAPVFYKSLAEQPRRSGLLTPNIGNSSRRGRMVGAGYYWAYSRSHDATYRSQWFTQRGFAHHVDLRGRPSATSEYNVFLYGVNDRGEKQPGGERRKKGGLVLSASGHAELGGGFNARLDANYLTSLRFRTAFTESLYEAIASEVHSAGFVDKHWPGFGLTLVGARIENIQNAGSYLDELKGYLPDEKVSIRKLPQVEFQIRRRRYAIGRLQFWVSMESSAGLLRRSQPRFQTRHFTERLDFQPRLMTALRWKGFTLLPGVSLRETYYGSRMEEGRVGGANISRFGREFTLELVPPALARVGDGPRWLGDKVKHVIEPRAVFRHAAGYRDFNRLIRFDEIELAANTTELEVSLANRLFVKRGEEVSELLSWDLWHARYFDPSFGGAVSAFDAAGRPRRNVIASSIGLTAFSFLDGPRRYSPVVSALRIAPLAGFGVEWRSDYDPFRRRPVNSWLTGDWRRSIYSLGLGHNLVRSGPQLSASANEFRGRFALGGENRRGWSSAFDSVYDFRNGVMRHATAQITYNTDCCGFSVQYSRLGLTDRNDHVFRAAFMVANIGSFGTLRRQERLF